MVHELIREALKRQKEAEKRRGERKGREEEWHFRILQPPPARWRPIEIPLAALVKRIGIRHKRPELWDLCRDLEDPLRCYRVLVERTKDREMFGLLLRALMSGGDVKTVLSYIERGDKNGLKEYIYSRFR